MAGEGLGWGMLVSLAAVAAASLATSPAAPFADRREAFGSVLAPALLPNGALALHGHAGFPEVEAAFRQGFSGFELNGRFLFDYYRIAVGVEAGARAFAMSFGPVQLAPSLSAGVGQNFGATYFDPTNRFSFGVVVRPGATATLRVSPGLYGILRAELPWEHLLTATSSFRFWPSGGLGAELYVSDDFTVSVLARGGVEVASEAPTVRVRPLLGVQVGFGMRLF